MLRYICVVLSIWVKIYDFFNIKYVISFMPSIYVKVLWHEKDYRSVDSYCFEINFELLSMSI